MNDRDISGPDHAPSAAGSEQTFVKPSTYQALNPGALSAVTDELVARLSSRLGQDASANTRVPQPPSDAEINAFSSALIAADAGVPRDLFASLREAGKTPDTLSLDYIAAAARRLGEWWSADKCSFLDVTVGSARLHILQRSLRSEYTSIGVARLVSQNALFATIPGESHALGISIAADFFHRAGWHVDLCSPESIDVLCARLLGDKYDLVGLSAGCMTMTDTVVRTVECIRAVQPDIRIVLGGYLTELDPGLTAALGVDAVPKDITSAPFLLQNTGSATINH